MRKFAVIIIVNLIPLFLFAQNSYMDSLYQAYENGSGMKKYDASYRYLFGVLETDTIKTAQLLNDLEDQVNQDETDVSIISYAMGYYSIIRGRLEMVKGNHEEELTYLQQAFDHSKKVEGREKHLLQANIFQTKASYYNWMNQFDEAIQEFKKVEKSYKLAHPSRKGSANTNHHLATIYTKLLEYDSALIYANRAQDIIGDNTDIPNHYLVTYNKAWIFNKMNLPDSTIALLTDDYLKKCKTLTTYEYGAMLLALAEAHGQNKNLKKADKYFSEGKYFIESSELKEVLREKYLIAKHKIALAKEDFEQSYYTLSEFKNYTDSLHQDKTDKKFLNLQTKYQTAIKDYEIQGLVKENKYQNNIMKLGGSFLAIIIATLFFLFKNRDEKIKAIQAKNNTEIKIALKYNTPNPDIEDEFLKDIVQCIQENLTNDNFTVEDLVIHSGMSRSNMNKKIKSLTNKTAVGLIRDVRLEKAYDLLIKNNKNISEIAFEVGFSNPNYFSHSFKEKFGYPPSEILKN